MAAGVVAGLGLAGASAAAPAKRPPDRGDTGQFACSLMSSSDLMGIYGFTSVPRELNGGNPGPFGSQPGYSDCLANATGASHHPGTTQVSNTVAIYASDSDARKAFAQQKSGYQYSKSGIGNGLVYNQGYFLLWHGRNLVQGGVEGEGGWGGSLHQTVEFATKTNYRFAHPAPQPVPPRPPKSDPAPDPCARSNSSLEKQLKRVGIKAKVTHQRQFSDVPDFPWQCQYSAGPLGTYYVNTVSVQDLKREGYMGTLTELFKQNSQGADKFPLRKHGKAALARFAPRARTSVPDFGTLWAGAYMVGIELSRRINHPDDEFGAMIQPYSENHIPHKDVQKLKNLLKPELGRYKKYLSPEDYDELQREVDADAKSDLMGLVLENGTVGSHL